MGRDKPWDWGPSTGHMWRTAGDIGLDDNQWEAFLQALDQNAQKPEAAGSGAWNDPDVLQAGLDRMSDMRTGPSLACGR